MTEPPRLPDGADVRTLPFAFGGPVITGTLRARPEDFQVDEILGFEPDGQGEHAMLQVRMRNTNTAWFANRLARHAGVPGGDVGYAGLKDRNALTTQWYSVRLAGRPEPDWGQLESVDIQIRAIARHSRKLRRGAHKFNRFRIRVTGVEGDRAGLERLLGEVASEGFPNFFGEQRFGRGGENIRAAEALFLRRHHRVDRSRRGYYLSAVRSMLFNRVLSARIDQANWSTPVRGELVMLEGSHARFLAPEVDGELLQRARRMDIHPSGPLWGRSGMRPAASAASIENEALADSEFWRQGLERYGLDYERRPLRCAVRALEYSWRDTVTLELGFDLSQGSYATALLRECLAYASAQTNGGAPSNPDALPAD